MCHGCFGFRWGRVLFVFLVFPAVLTARIPSGEEWNDLSIRQINKLPPQSTLFTPIVLENGTVRPHTASSHPFQILNGIWKFHLAPSPHAVPEGMHEAEFDDSDWGEIRVPATWQTQGYGVPIYSNSKQPWNGTAPHIEVDEGGGNPTGCYRTRFELPSDLSGRRVVLHFAGANSAFYVWLNGQFVGYSQDGFLPAEFEVSDALKDGENQLTVQVMRWSDGSYMELWDTWKNSGIFRNVYLYATGEVYIRDLEFVAGLTPDYTDGRFRSFVDVKNESDEPADQLALKVSLLDGGGKIVFEDEEESPVVAPGGEVRMRAEATLPGVATWSAEKPSLYTCVVELILDGRVIEMVRRPVGFRSVERDGNQMRVNGKAVTIKGVNRWEIHPRYGRHVPYETLVEEVKLMKRHNINAVRTAHAPHDPVAMDLYDRYGLYVCDEVNNETNNGKVTDSEDWTPVFIERTRGTVERDKNHPSVIMWSLGNESGAGKNLEAQARWIRDRDPSRLIQYTRNGARFDYVDIFSQTYPALDPNFGRNYTPRSMHNDTQPVILNEFAHSMGNATGNLKEYMELFENPEYPGLQGGFIWDWIDQGLSLPDDPDCYDFGSVFGKTLDGNFCLNGIVFPDRSPQPAMADVKAAYQNIMTTMPDRAKAEVVIENRHFFTPVNNDHFSGEWILTKDGYVVGEGDFELPVIAPRRTAKCALPLTLPALPADEEYVLTLHYRERQPTRWHDGDFIVASSQVILNEPQRNLRDRPVAAGRLKVSRDDGDLVVKSRSSTWRVDLESGRLSSWKLRHSAWIFSGQTEFIAEEAGPRFTAWRAPIDNDISWSAERRYGRDWIESSLGALERVVVDVKEEPLGEGHYRVSVTTQAAGKEPMFTIRTHYNFLADGRLYLAQEVEVEATFETGELPRLGMGMALPDGFDHVEWYGRGPQENYVDRHLGALLGRYESDVADLYVPYVRPQAHGNRYDVREVRIFNDQGRGLRISSPGIEDNDSARSIFPSGARLDNALGGTFQFTALPFSESELESALLTRDLVKSGRHYLTLDILHAGVGNLPNFRLLPYQVPAVDTQYVFLFEPLRSDTGSR